MHEELNSVPALFIQVPQKKELREISPLLGEQISPSPLLDSPRPLCII